MKAIETRYNGYRFRSRLEARWAVFFDELGIEWQYEPEGFVFDDGTAYLPDFLLPHINLRTTGDEPTDVGNPGIWIEVKGKDMDDYRPASMLGAHNDRAVVLLTGNVCTGSQKDQYHQLYPGWDNYMVWMKCYGCGRVKIEFYESNYMHCHVCGSRCDHGHPDLSTAVESSRSARFEHGEYGAAR